MTFLLFFGAGASRPFGIPTMQEMVKDFETELEHQSSPSKELYTKIKTAQENNGIRTDIESVFSVIHGIANNLKPKDMGYLAHYYISSHNIDDNFSVAEVEQAKKLKESLQDFIKQKCVSNFSSTTKADAYSKSYETLFKLLPVNKERFSGMPLAVDWRAYTTNYDLIFEDFWADYIKLNDYFNPFGTSSLEKFNQNHNPPPNKTLIKLHGSLSWVIDETGSIMKKPSSGFTRLAIQGEVMIFPIQQKDLYLHPWITLFQDLKNYLQQCTGWIVIGYAFNDEFIFEIFIEALLRDPAKKLVIINTHAKELVTKFPPEVMERVILLPLKFGDKHFGNQLEDYFAGIRTFDITLKTVSNTLAFSSSHPLTYFSIKGNQVDMHVVNSGTTRLDMEGTVAHNDNEVLQCKIKVKFEPPYDKDVNFNIITDRNCDVDITVSIAGKMIKSESLRTTSTPTVTQGNPSASITIQKDELFAKS